MSNGEVLRRLKRSAVEEKPYLVWNACIDLVALTDYRDLSAVQQIAKLVFEYDSEIQNGGHLQYFENQGLALIGETFEALTAIGAHRQREILDGAVKKQRSVNPNGHKIESVEEYVTVAREGLYDTFDTDYYDCVPKTIDLLGEYFDGSIEHFVEIVAEDASGDIWTMPEFIPVASPRKRKWWQWWK